MKIQENLDIAKRIYPEKIQIGGGYYWIPENTNKGQLENTDWIFENEDPKIVGWFLYFEIYT